jgi:hypothetical protein
VVFLRSAFAAARRSRWEPEAERAALLKRLVFVLLPDWLPAKQLRPGFDWAAVEPDRNNSTKIKLLRRVLVLIKVFFVASCGYKNLSIT